MTTSKCPVAHAARGRRRRSSHSHSAVCPGSRADASTSRSDQPTRSSASARPSSEAHRRRPCGRRPAYSRPTRRSGQPTSMKHATVDLDPHLGLVAGVATLPQQPQQSSLGRASRFDLADPDLQCGAQQRRAVTPWRQNDVVDRRQQAGRVDAAFGHERIQHRSESVEVRDRREVDEGAVQRCHRQPSDHRTMRWRHRRPMGDHVLLAQPHAGIDRQEHLRWCRAEAMEEQRRLVRRRGVRRGGEDRKHGLLAVVGRDRGSGVQASTPAPEQPLIDHPGELVPRQTERSSLIRPDRAVLRRCEPERLRHRALPRPLSSHFHIFPTAGDKNSLVTARSGCGRRGPGAEGGSGRPPVTRPRRQNPDRAVVRTGSHG